MAAAFYDKFVVAEDGSVESLSSYEARKKPKKTRSKGPALIFAITEVERQKLEQEKASLVPDYKKSIMAKTFIKFATSFSSLKSSRQPGGGAAENSIISQSAKTLNFRASSPPSCGRSNSNEAHRLQLFPAATGLRSAIKDRNEEIGLCQKSKHVKWASFTDEPAERTDWNAPAGQPLKQTPCEIRKHF